jgi:hypothetical protein
VSRRFLFGDRLGRKLIVVGEGTNHTVDFVRADSAGFGDIAAMEIDDRRGDLWVMSAGLANGAAALHKLQLVSGRPLKSFPIAADPEAVTPVDLAVTPAGVVVALDSAGHQLLVLRSKGTAVERVMRVDAAEPASLAATGDEGIVYVAYRDGVSRVDLRARTATKSARNRSRSLISSGSGGAGRRDRDSRRCRWHAPHRPSRPQRQLTRVLRQRRSTARFSRGRPDVGHHFRDELVYLVNVRRLTSTSFSTLR